MVETSRGIKVSVRPRRLDLQGDQHLENRGGDDLPVGIDGDFPSTVERLNA